MTIPFGVFPKDNIAPLSTPSLRVRLRASPFKSSLSAFIQYQNTCNLAPPLSSLPYAALIISFVAMERGTYPHTYPHTLAPLPQRPSVLDKEWTSSSPILAHLPNPQVCGDVALFSCGTSLYEQRQKQAYQGFSFTRPSETMYQTTIPLPVFTAV